MKVLKRIYTLLFIAIITISSVGTTVFAAETKSNEKTVVETFDFEITPQTSNSGIVPINSINSIDNTFNVYLEHRGSNRTYSGNYIRYTIRITDVNGNPVNNIMAVRLYDANNNLKCEDQFWADGNAHAVQDIPVSSSTSYYFKYLLAYGTARTLKVHMIITSYN